MTTEQSAQDSESALVGRLSAALAPEVETPAPPQDEPLPELAQVDAEDGEVADEAPAEPDFVDFADDDGTTYKIPAALKDKVLMRSDYTRKTMHAANLAETAEDRMQYAEAREQFHGAVVGEIGELRSLQARLKEYDGIDTAALYNSDPGTAMRIRDQREDLRRSIAEKERAIGDKARQLQSMTEAHHAKQWELAVNGVKQRIGQYTPGEDAAMLKQVEVLGLTPKEIKGRYADPRILHAIYKAAKWDALQNSKGKTMETVRTAPPVLKPGAATTNAAVSKEKAMRARLKSSGDYRDAARLMLAKGKL